MRVLKTEADLGAHLPPGGVLVPTMGALHAGHLALVKRGVQAARTAQTACVVSIFVNPTQFNDPKDMAAYPRTLDADLAACRDCGATDVFVPEIDVIYPMEREPLAPELPAVATEPKLEDAFRPGHFLGVCQVVWRLFELTRPSVAVFGEKDWQQLRAVTAMSESMGLPVRILGVPTVRESDGLAMSSRNRHLGESDRKTALGLYRALLESQGVASVDAAEAHMRKLMTNAGVEVEYAAIRDARTLTKRPGQSDGPFRAFVAGRVGPTRLLDNMEWS